MPSLSFPYVNIALDIVGLVVVLIIFMSCLDEILHKTGGSKSFLLLLSFIIVAIVADIVACFGEGHPELSYMTLIANTVATCAGYCVIACFMSYMKESLPERNKAITATVMIFRVLCVLFVGFLIGNIFGEYVFTVNEQGHYVHSSNPSMSILYLQFPLLSLIAVILMSLCTKHVAGVTRFTFIIYTVFPVAGVMVDYLVHGLSITYIGLVIGVLVIYTNIYLQKQRIIDAQRNALMMSQINPHFMYNTLSTIAAMCDISPKQAQSLTVEFAQYLRRNLDTLTSDTLIPFDKEIEHVECYLKIEKARFRERLNVIWSIQCKDFEIPPLSIQPLVENAVRHGITKKASGGTVRIATYSTEKSYVIEIKDDGVGFDSEMAINDGKMHVGLANVRSRLSGMCKGTLVVKSTVGVGTRVTVEIPKKKGKRNEHTGT